MTDYGKFKKNGRPPVPIAERFVQRGWDVVPGNLDSYCWECRGSRGRNGHGRIGQQDGTGMYTHRLAYELWIGPIPDGMLIRHRCDNPPCVNPAHLVPGTDADNMNDRDVRGRHHPARGTKHGRSKLTEDIVRSIRMDSRSDVELANQYSVGRICIYKVRNRLTWKHVT